MPSTLDDQVSRGSVSAAKRRKKYNLGSLTVCITRTYKHKTFAHCSPQDTCPRHGTLIDSSLPRKEDFIPVHAWGERRAESRAEWCRGRPLKETTGIPSEYDTSRSLSWRIYTCVWKITTTTRLPPEPELSSNHLGPYAGWNQERTRRMAEQLQNRITIVRMSPVTYMALQPGANHKGTWWSSKVKDGTTRHAATTQQRMATNAPLTVDIPGGGVKICARSSHDPITVHKPKVCLNNEEGPWYERRCKVWCVSQSV